ncbi:cytochrome P450 1A1-like, partial [Sinocyclocheilus rhinocerous]|uniref:cytochrome P450 1A1-like n=1 Tax=Sinocyclocheilus rhinocerous TaxID=307959 RepID=UPI0007BA7C13
NCIRDITDALIAMCEDRQEDEETAMLSNSQIIHSVIDIFGAGFDTIITGLQWSLLYLIKFPDIQAKILQEIGEVSKGAIETTLCLLENKTKSFPIMHIPFFSCSATSWGN